MAIKWLLRKACADRNIWRSVDLQNLLEQKSGLKLTHKSVNDLLTGEPKQIRLSTLNAICNVLECNPQDFLVYTPDATINLLELKNVADVAGNGKHSKIPKPPV
jgi:DNA-binding Xre family transcriptional regulator